MRIQFSRNDAMRFSLLLGAAMILPRFAAAQTPSITDIRIGDPAVTYLDPEFWQAGQMMVWQEQYNGQVWVCQVSAVDGSLIPSNGKGQAMGFAAPITRTYNGPEFGYSQQGLGVYYTGISPNGSLQLFRSRIVPNAQPEQITFENSPLMNNLGVITSLDFNDGQCRLVYFKGRSALPATIYWMYESNQAAEIPIGTPGTLTLAGPRWVPGQLAFVTNQRIGRYAQIVFADALSGQRSQVTADIGDKSDPFAWHAPDFNNEMLMMATLNSNSLAVYRKINGVWTRIYVVAIPGAGKHYSGEPFVYRNHSYATVAVETADPNNKEIWVVGLNPTQPFAVRANDDRAMLRVDPESFVLQDRLFVSQFQLPGREHGAE